MNIEVKNLAGLDEAAQKVLEFAQNERFFIFEGDMGAGKTTFIKALTKALGVTDVVSSPTFSIVNEYEGKDVIIYHFDFYRLKNLQEAYDIGYEEYFYSEHICLIEWPEKVEELLPEHYVKIEITAPGETERLLSISKI
ncbi:tRNA (adenosine(37)-N6)-threonylcarbamoyltransferase complex ATPase subunit type 1 TsaE [Pedobacter sp. N36a]|uniref:tRNA (adenosine(37)-N6)-threonylcarbamoyltransferase complex ATPase subunit type 1 TsaE n=1 Tax=Pedobacter sp. N36a TaxID=2767996 RepID=UPI0016569D69|nr:tRNA (adenosine(37)-N6)-threonylcarbamoyltransferase complex ATPase subunit type 1 TsaE [Pedobacter sp. N36a]MBC8987134.1 tRNA (adenosine(37)-N6)-threonylcarbamoyltransferase complex ATPase subunit type 1 TsaE [Pedobacter sp. N36a]